MTERTRQIAVIPEAASRLVSWPFDALNPRDRGQVRVRVTGTGGLVSPWSDPVSVFAGYWRPRPATRLWVALFFLLVRMQRRFHLVPPLVAGATAAPPVDSSGGSPDRQYT